MRCFSIGKRTKTCVKITLLSGWQRSLRNRSTNQHFHDGSSNGKEPIAKQLMSLTLKEIIYLPSKKWIKHYLTGSYAVKIRSPMHGLHMRVLGVYAIIFSNDWSPRRDLRKSLRENDCAYGNFIQSFLTLM